MDMQLYARVLWRWKLVVALGLLVAVALTFLSIYRVPSNGHLSARKHSEYVSYATLFVTQQGFPSGRLGISPLATQAGNSVPHASTGQLADLARLTSLAILYSHLASSDAVRAIMLHDGPVTGTIQAAALPATQNSSEVLPLISIAAITDSRPGAIALASNASSALVSYIEQEQTRNGIPTTDRVQLTLLNRPYQAKIYAQPSKTLPVAIFLTVLIATIGMAFILENLRPRIRTVQSERMANVRSA
jgi:capsular polysaccharide biosynthesis protein